MSVRIQVILSDEDAMRFKYQAQREEKSLSAWFREAGQLLLEQRKTTLQLKAPDQLERFFDQCRHREKGREPDWPEHRNVIEEGYGKALVQ